MKQYLQLLEDIKEKGCYKPAAREGMPGTQSLFGYQFRHNLQDGFPLLTTKKMYWKGIVVELLWFLRGDTNIKYLIDNGVNIWNQDAYNYYCKIAKVNDGECLNIILQPVSNKTSTRTPNKEDIDCYSMFLYEEFIEKIKSTLKEHLPSYKNYKLGDCGYQYGRVWRNWNYNHGPSVVLEVASHLSQYDAITLKKQFYNAMSSSKAIVVNSNDCEIKYKQGNIDQIKVLIEGLKNNPESRRHIVTAIDPAHENDLALYWCHCLIQFNCRPLTNDQRLDLMEQDTVEKYSDDMDYLDNLMEVNKVPKYYLDCQLYQRSADVVLGVPFNIASYALLTEILAKICNMIPGEFIHTFGDVHIYDNHKEAVEEQLKRTQTELPTLELNSDYLWEGVLEDNFNYNWLMEALVNYNSQEAIKAKLSTGMIK
mgnify:CR=1 FL=1